MRIVTCAGGGIPVTRDDNGGLHGVEAVLDKDLTVALLATALGAHALLILTDVPAVISGYGTARAQLIRRAAVAERPDSDIRTEIIDEVLVRYLDTNPVLVGVDVTDGVVTLSGEVGSKSMLPLIFPAIRAVDGVVEVEGRLTYAVDDIRKPGVLDLPDH